MRRVRLHPPSPALVISIVALVMAAGGVSYAAFKLPTNSVGSKQLKKNAVTTPKITNGAVTASKINTSGLTVPNAAHAGTAGSAGSAGSAISATHATSAGSATSPATLGVGQTETGSFATAANASAASNASLASISFPFPLTSAPAGDVIGVGGSPTAACPGSVTAPAATAGNLCVYVGALTNAEALSAFSLCRVEANVCDAVDNNGAALEVFSSASGFFDATGTWAVTG